MTEPASIASLVDDLTALWSNAKIIDLSHAIEAGIPVWSTHPTFVLNPWENYGDDVSMMNQLSLGEHTGTHVDAPIHFVPGAADARAIPLSKCVGRALTIPCRVGETDSVSERAIRTWERENTPIRRGDIVILDFDWARRWTTTDRSTFLEAWPGLTADAAEYLVQAGAIAVGTDTPSIDIGNSEDFPAHFVLLRAGLHIFENLASLKALPAQSFFLALPLPIIGASGTPVRAIAVVPN